MAPFLSHCGLALQNLAISFPPCVALEVFHTDTLLRQQSSHKKIALTMRTVNLHFEQTVRLRLDTRTLSGTLDATGRCCTRRIIDEEISFSTHSFVLLAGRHGSKWFLTRSFHFAATHCNRHANHPCRQLPASEP